MRENRFGGSIEQTKGAIKEAVGKVPGDAKLTHAGMTDRVDGRIQNAVGSLKDTLNRK